MLGVYCTLSAGSGYNPHVGPAPKRKPGQTRAAGTTWCGVAAESCACSAHAATLCTTLKAPPCAADVLQHPTLRPKHNWVAPVASACLRARIVTVMGQAVRCSRVRAGHGWFVQAHFCGGVLNSACCFACALLSFKHTQSLDVSQHWGAARSLYSPSCLSSAQRTPCVGGQTESAWQAGVV